MKFNHFIDIIEQSKNVLDNEDLIREFNTVYQKENKTKILTFLVKNFNSYDPNKAFECIVLINIGYLSSLNPTGGKFEDINFLNFIIENLIMSEKYYRFGLISLHLLLNEYVISERYYNRYRYNNYSFNNLINQVENNKKEVLYQTVIKGVLNDEKIIKNYNNYFLILDKYLSTDFIKIKEITFTQFFDKIFKDNKDLLDKYSEQFFKFIENNSSQIFLKDNNFTIFKHIYVNLYDDKNELFKNIDDFLEKNIDNIDNLKRVRDLVYNFMERHWIRPFYKKFYIKYFNLLYQLREKKAIKYIGDLLLLFKFGSLKDSANWDLDYKPVIEKFLNDFLYFRSEKAGNFNVAYWNLEVLVGRRPKNEGIEIINKPQKILRKFNKKFPECFFELNKQLNNLNFWKKYSILSPNAELWLKIIKKYFGFLRSSFRNRNFFRKQAQNWEHEVKDMNPWTSNLLEQAFGIKHHSKSEISDGHSDNWVDDIPIEDKLLRTREKLNNENVIEEKYKKEKHQIFREEGLSGFGILTIADIRDEIKYDKLPAFHIQRCFKIIHENDFWIAVFLFQSFNKPPSEL